MGNAPDVRVQIDGQMIPLSGRAAAIVRFIANQRVLLNSWPRSNVEIHCAGSKIKPKIEIFPDEVSA